MSELFDFYQQQLPLPSATLPWLAALQTKAQDDFQRYGFPGRHHEEWKYTNVEGLLQQRFIRANHQANNVVSADSSAGPFAASASYYVAIHNGQVDINALAALPHGVIIQPLTEALVHHADKIKPYLGQLLHHQHGFQAFNTAAWQTGLFIYLPDGVCLDKPLVINHWQDNAQQAVYSRHLLVANEQSQATVINYFQGAADCAYLTNTVTEAYIGLGAHIDHYTIQCESKAAFHLGHLTVKQAANSQFNSHALNLGGKLVRSDIDFYLHEAHASCLMNGIYMPADKQHIDHHTTVNHLTADCASIQDYKGVLIGQAQAVFNGKVVVAPNAQHTKAQQQNKNLLLSPQAQINTKPQLEIFADDVTCSHGATVGQLDEDAIFYLTTRGIERIDACRYLIQAFAADNLRLIPNRVVADWMASLINQQWG